MSGYPDNDQHEDDFTFWAARGERNDLNSKIMLTAIVSLSVVIVVVIALHIYARCVLRRQARRRTAVSQLGLTVAHVRSREQPKRGLDPAVIASLPGFAFKQRDVGDQDNPPSTTECSVCLGVIENGEMARLLPNCNHIFHAECIDKWLGSHSSCPICRTEAEPRVQPEPREPPAGLAGVSAPTAPPAGLTDSELSCMELGTSEDGTPSAAKVSGSSSRFTSFKRMLSRERSSPRIHSHGEDAGVEDLERQ